MPKLTMVTKIESGECPIRSILDRVGDKWSVLIFVALKDEAKRFNEIKRLIGDISQRVLTSTLRRLEADGYISRKVYPTAPPKVEYSLTPRGQELFTLIHPLILWAKEEFVKAYSKVARPQKTQSSFAGIEQISKVIRDSIYIDS